MITKLFLDGQPIDEKSVYTQSAFWNHDTVEVSFYYLNERLILSEEVYFFLMASMRKLRMSIPLSFTLEYFQNLLAPVIEGSSGRIRLKAFRTSSLFKSPTSLLYRIEPESDIFDLKKRISIDVLKEVSVGNSLHSSLQIPTPEDTYARIYSSENDLDDVILLNAHKRIARSIYGNLLLLQGNTIRIPDQLEGAKISPLMESLVTYLNKKEGLKISQEQISPFETQQAEEILSISETKGLRAVHQIRNKKFNSERWNHYVQNWKKYLSSYE